LWWKLAAVRAIKRKKKSTKRIQASAKKNQKKRSKVSGKRSTIKSLPSLDFESIIFVAFYYCSSFCLTAHCLYSIYHKTLAGANPNLIFSSFS